MDLPSEFSSQTFEALRTCKNSRNIVVPSSQLRKNLEERKAVITVVGLGYVGLPLALGFAQQGFNVMELDDDAPKSSVSKVGQDFHLAFSPERVDPGNPSYHTCNTTKVVGGVTPECTENRSALPVSARPSRNSLHTSKRVWGAATQSA